MSTLFSEIQRLLERTYSSVGVNLEECLIDRRRCTQLSALAGAQAAELSMLARTFLRAADGRLRVGIYYSSWLIEQLEKHDPRSGLSDANINALIAFVEEINHALHAALKFQRGEAPTHDEAYARNLELQAQVDPYLVLLLFVAFFRRPGKITRADRRWLRFHMFESRHSRSFRDRTISARYAETTCLAQSYTRYLESLAASRRVEEIRLFHALEYGRKRERILALRDRIRKP
ncbi:MAG TPA: hypothetical protein VIZ87_02280 [Terrimicrobium sp.]